MKVSGSDSVESWLICVCAFFFVTVTWGFLSSSASLFVLIHDTYSFSREEASLPGNVMTALSHLLSVFAGAIHFKLKTSKTLLLASSLSFIGTTMPCLQFGKQNEIRIWLCISLAIRAGGMCLVFPVLFQAVSSLFVLHKSKALSILTLGSDVSGMIYPYLVDYGYEKYGFRGCWLILASVTAQSFVFSQLIGDRMSIIPEKANSIRELQLREFAEPNTLKNSYKMSFLTITSSLLKQIRFYLLLLVCCNIFFNTWAVRTVIIDYGRDNGLDKFWYNTLVSIISLGAVSAKIVVPILLDKYLWDKYLCLAFISVLSALTCYALTLSSEFSFVTTCFVLGLSMGAAVVANNPMLTAFGTSLTSILTGFIQSASGIMFLGLSKLIGAVRDEGQSYALMFYVIALVNIISAILLVSVYKFKMFPKKL